MDGGWERGGMEGTGYFKSMSTEWAVMSGSVTSCVA